MADTTIQAVVDRIETHQHDAAVLAESAKNTGWNRMIAVAGAVAVVISLLSWLVLVTIDRTAIADRIGTLDRDASNTQRRLDVHDKEITELKLTSATISTKLDGLRSDSTSNSNKLDALLGRQVSKGTTP